MEDATIDYDGGWEEARDAGDAFADWMLAADGDAHEGYAGRSAAGRFTADRTPLLRDEAADAATVSARSRPKLPPASVRTQALQAGLAPEVEERLRWGVAKEAKRRGLDRATVMDERRRRYGRGESLEVITGQVAAPAHTTTPSIENAADPSRFPDVVFVGGRDRGYHRRGCPLLRGEPTKVHRSTSTLQARTPCPECLPGPLLAAQPAGRKQTAATRRKKKVVPRVKQKKSRQVSADTRKKKNIVQAKVVPPVPLLRLAQEAEARRAESTAKKSRRRS